MISYMVNQNTAGFDFLQTTIPIVLLLALILMITDAIIEAKSHDKFKSELSSKNKLLP